MKSISRIIITILFVQTTGLFCQSQQISSGQSRIKANLEFLASDELQGRDAASQFEKVASKFISSEFIKYGVTPFGDDGTYFQNFDVYSYWRESESKITLLDAEGNNISDLMLGYGFSVFADLVMNPESLNKTFDLVFGGYGITADEFKYDDYSEIDITGKVVIIYPGEPYSGDENYFNGSEPTDYSFFNNKLRTAFGKGAAGVLLIPGDFIKGFWHIIRKQSLEEKMYTDYGVEPERRIAPPIGVLSLEVINELFSNEKLSYNEISKLVEDGNDLEVFEFEKKIIFNIQSNEAKKRARNVIGIIEGSDPVMKNEYVVIGAHYDHVGTMGDEIYNGADDNGSGTVAIMEIARRLAARKSNKRTVLAALYSCEEKGLNGSRWLSEHLDSSKVVAKINIDMCGRGSIDSISTLGADISSNDLNNILNEINDDTSRFVLTPIHEGWEQSDHYPFYLKHVPVVTFYDAMSEDLHRPTDDTHKINFDKIYKTVDLVENLVLRLANDEERPAFNLTTD
ncbi:M28 family peptidase [Bacteroidota bacterium]